MWFYMILLVIGSKFSFSNSDEIRSNRCQKHVDDRIAYGVNASPHEFPMLALVRANKNYCGGVVITQWHAMTAAHCTLGVAPWEVSIRVGVHYRNIRESTTQMVFVQAIYSAGFTPRRPIHDLAILKTKKNIAFNEYVQPACLPTQRLRLHKESGLVAGWGATRRPQLDHLSHILQKTDVEIFYKDYCESKYNIRTPRGGQLLCAMTNDEDHVCQGDSGGPLMMKDRETGNIMVVGIISFGYEDNYGLCPSTLPGFYTDVSAYLDWIKKKLDY